MRTVRRYALDVSLLLALTFSGTASATPSQSRREDTFSRIKQVIIRILDDVGIKMGLPPG